MAEAITLTTPDGTAEAFLARPAGTSKGGVVFFMDAIGLRPRIADMADRVASWGYTVLAPNFFYRWGTAAETAPSGPLVTPEERAAFFDGGLMERVNGYTTELRAVDNSVWLDALSSEIAAGHHIGTTGYCMGSRCAVSLAAQFPDEVAAAGGFHGGGMVTDAPDSPHRQIADAKAEFFFGWADNDASMTPENVADFDAALNAAGLTYRSELFEGSIHGYTMTDTASYGAEHEQRHWRELEALYGRAL